MILPPPTPPTERLMKAVKEFYEQDSTEGGVVEGVVKEEGGAEEDGKIKRNPYVLCIYIYIRV